MENFVSLLELTEKSLSNIRGIFDSEDVENKIKELEKISLKKNFWKDKSLVKKTVKQKNFLKIFLILTKNLCKILKI